MRNAATDDVHGALADPTRRALLEALRAASAPLGVRELAAALRLHPNSVREQLARLVEVGLVSVTPAPPTGRGRPSHRYAATPVPPDPFRALAGALADQVASLPDAAGAWEAAGERWGRDEARAASAASAASVVPAASVASSTPSAPGVPAATTPEAAVLALLDQAGFAPGPLAPDDDAIDLHACPFLPLERRHLPVVCGVHLGFIRGALRELGSSRDAVSIEPLVRPDLCVARLSRTPDA